ncbi:hypothetical protein ACHAPU_000795 [Fusarium lateritium]
MDPLSAFGLAGTIAQFVGFAAKLISLTAGIHSSSGGAHDEFQNIEDVYSKLVEFSSGLQIDLVVAPQVPNDGFKNPLPTYQGELKAIQELSKSSRRDCNRLLDIVRGIQLEKSSKATLKSFRSALKYILKSDEISQIDKRLQRTQSSLTLQICSMSSKYHSIISQQYQRLQDTSSLYHIRQQAQLIDIHQMLDRLAGAQRKASSQAALESHEISSLALQMSALSFATKYSSEQQAVIRSLSFKNRQARYEKISEAHMQTFRWTFEKGQTEEAVGLGLHEWLKPDRNTVQILFLPRWT